MENDQNIMIDNIINGNRNTDIDTDFQQTSENNGLRSTIDDIESYLVEKYEKKIISSIRKEISKEVREIIRASSETSENNALNSTIDDIETYIIDKHQQNLISKLKEEIFNEIKPLMKNSIKKHPEGAIIASLKEHNISLISSLYFIREEIKQKNMIINTLITKYDSVKTDYHHSPYNANGNPSNPFIDHIHSETESETSNIVNHNIELPNTVFENNMNINDKHVTKNRRKLK